MSSGHTRGNGKKNGRRVDSYRPRLKKKTGNKKVTGYCWRNHGCFSREDTDARSVGLGCKHVRMMDPLLIAIDRKADRKTRACRSRTGSAHTLARTPQQKDSAATGTGRSPHLSPS